MKDNKPNILIIGFGSIGRRHYKNLVKCAYNNITVFDPGISEEEIPEGLSQISKLTLECLSHFDIAFVCSPNNLHIEHASLCVEAGCDVFIEKPLSFSLEGVDQIIAEANRKKVIVMVACNWRFHPAFRSLKKALNKNILGDVYRIEHEFGYYLPSWRPQADYRNNYAAKRETGGGIILDDVHEFDLLFWLNNFESVTDHCLLATKSSDLDIETEDQAVGAFLFSNKVLGIVRCDYLQKTYKRTCRIVGEKGVLYWSFADNEVAFFSRDSREILYSDRAYELNDMYVSELQAFLEACEERSCPQNALPEAREVLSFITGHQMRYK